MLTKAHMLLDQYMAKAGAPRIVDLARASGLSHDEVSHVLYKRRDFSKKVMKGIHKATGIPLSAFLEPIAEGKIRCQTEMRKRRKSGK